MKMLRLFAGALGVVGLALFFAAGTARADCNADDALYADDFEFLDGSWGDKNDRFDVEDGTMVVVEGGRDHVNEQVQIAVTSVLQTSAGRMVFGRYEGTG